MRWTWHGQTDKEREIRTDRLLEMAFIRRDFQHNGLRLVVDNACPVRRHERGIQGIRRIYGHDQGGPDNVA